MKKTVSLVTINREIKRYEKILANLIELKQEIKKQQTAQRVYLWRQKQKEKK
nr:MAG: hypothetical protein [Microvirus sp.]